MKGSAVNQTYARVKGGLCITDVTCRWVRPKDTNMFRRVDTYSINGGV